ncbi:MAG: class I SAM-dependent methyltransferase [bacterium]
MPEPQFKFDMEPVEKCPLCGSSSKSDHFKTTAAGGDAVTIVKCKTCTLVYLDPAPTRKSLSAFYGSVYLTPEYRKLDGARYTDPRQEIAASFQTMEQHVDLIKEYKVPSGRMLDIGCSYGAFLIEATSRGWSTEGIEPFEEGVEFCRGNLGLKVIQGEIPDADLPSESYDVITMWEIIEHLPEPVAAMKKANELAKLKGVLFITSPSADSPAARLLRERWIGLKLPTHLQFFNYSTLARLLVATGWSPVKIKSGGGYAGQIMAIAVKAHTDKG